MAKQSFIEQSTNFFKRLSTGQKLIFGGAILLVAIIIIILISSASKQNMAVLYNSLDPQDAAKIVEILNEKQIKYELRDNGTTILIERDKIYETRLQLASEGLPQTSTVGYEIFDRTNLGMSEFVQKLNYRRALEGELARTISSVQEIEKARVHIVIPEKALFEKDQKPPTASVILTLKSGRGINKSSIEGIQNLIAGSVEGMSPDNVTVVDHKGKILNEQPLDSKSLSGITAQQHEQQKKVEQYLADKVQTMLNEVLGPGNAQVRVNTELDFTQKETTITDFDPEKQVERSTQTIEESQETSDSLIVNNSGDVIQSVVPYASLKKSQSNVIANYEIPKTVEHIVQEVGKLKRLSVAVVVNGTYKIVEQNNQRSLQYLPRTEEEMQKLTEIVKNSIGYDPTRNDQVSVINVPFSTRYEEEELLKLEEMPWWQNPDIQKLILLGAIILITTIIMFRILRAKDISEKMGVTFLLPEKSLKESLEQEGLEDIELVGEDTILLPPESPSPLLLETMKGAEELPPLEGIAGKPLYDKEKLQELARAKIEGAPELTEDALMKLELKKKVQSYMENETENAVKLVRMLLSQESEEKQK